MRAQREHRRPLPDVGCTLAQLDKAKGLILLRERSVRRGVLNLFRSMSSVNREAMLIAVTVCLGKDMLRCYRAASAQEKAKNDK